MASAVSTDSVVVATQDQVSADLQGEAAILKLSSGIYYGLNPVGARIWELIQEPRSVREVRDTLTAEYEVDVNSPSVVQIESPRKLLPKDFVGESSRAWLVDFDESWSTRAKWSQELSAFGRALGETRRS